MVGNNNYDDDIIEDYEELTEDSEVRRVESARGGPVDRPTKQVRPSDHVRPGSSVSGVPGTGGPGTGAHARPKGQISKKQAKLIWIVCIAITVIGVGLFVADITVDPFKRHVAQTPAGGGADNNKGGSTLPPRKRNQELNEHQLAARAFAIAASEARRAAQGSTSHEAAWNALQDAQTAQRAARDERSDDALWAEAWRKYYEAAYLVEIFHHLHPYDDRDLPLVANLTDYPAMEEMSAEELDDEQIQKALGYWVVHNALRGQVDTLSRSFRELAVSNNVLNKEEYKEEFDALKERLEKARTDREFDAADLERLR